MIVITNRIRYNSNGQLTNHKLSAKDAEYMDRLDEKIIQILRENGRASNAEVARELKVSEGTIRRRIRKLVQSETVKIMAIPDPQKIGFNTVALIGIESEPAKMDDVANYLSNLKETQYVALTTGSFDIFVWVAVASTEELGNLLRTSISTAPGIKRSETFVNLAIRKRGFGLLG